MKLFKGVAFALLVFITTLTLFATASAQGGDVTRGKKLYDQDCAVCHGDRAQGRVGATLAKDFPGIRVDALLKEIISNGVQGSVMPAWAKSKGGPLSDAEIDDIVAYIRSLGNIAPTVVAPRPTTQVAPMPSPIATFPAGDAKRGAQVYTENCVLCHGANGEGRIGATLSRDWAGINVTTFLNTTIARGVAGSKMPAWSQSYGGPLTNQQIADVGAYVNTIKQTGAPAPTAVPVDVPQGGVVTGTLLLICFGLLVLVGAVVLAFGLAGSRKTA
jgi:mono/diheme cytochrome c family protein